MLSRDDAGRGNRMTDETAELVQLSPGGQRIYLAVERRGDQAVPGDEEDIAGRGPRLEQALDGLTGFATQLGNGLAQTEMSKVVVEFGCDVALESGSLVAIIGKASARSTFKVSLEWTKSAG